MSSAHIFKSSLSDVKIPVQSLTEFVFSGVTAEHDDRVAMIEGPTGREVTFGQMKKQMRQVGAALHKQGFKKGEVFALLLPNLPEFPVVFHAVASLGGTLTTMNPVYTEHEIEHQLKDAGASYMMTIPAFLDKAIAGCKAAGNIKQIYVIGKEVPENADGDVKLFGELLQNDGSECPSPDEVKIDPENDVVALPYSSGTTGLPKGVMLTHHNLVSNLVQITHPDLVDLTSDDTLIAVLPFFHIYGQVVICFAAMMRMARVVCMPKFDPVQFLELLAKHKVTRAHVVPPICVFLAKHPLVDKYDLSSLVEVFSGAAPLGKELSEAVVKRLNLKMLRQGYGMTEMSPASHVSTSDNVVFGSAGVLVPNTEAKILDVTTKEPVGPGKEGELCIRGPQVMKGYLNNDEATKSTIDEEGWIHTGDVAYVDEKGNMFIVDRLKELIKVKGFQVPPAELEALLLSHPSIADCAVIPVPDAGSGELPKAYVVKKADVTGEEIMEWVAKQVAPYKKIRFVEFTDKIPKSASGKILRRHLRAQERERAQAAAAAKLDEAADKSS